MKACLTCLWVFVVYAATCHAQSAVEEDLYEKLTTDLDRAKALESVLKDSDTYTGIILFTAASVALKEKRLEDSAFLFYAGQMRTRFDQKCFPAKGKGGDDPFVAYTALSRQLGSVINPAVMDEPKAFAKAMDRLKKWSPKAPEDYTPGYEFTERLPERDAHEAAKSNRNEFLVRMGDLATLLNDSDYFAASRIVRAYNLATDDKRPAKEDYQKATETMKRIEKEKNLKGFFSQN